MSGLLKILKSVAEEYGKHLNGSKIREFEAEDPLSASLLKQNLCSVNCRRVIFFTIPAVVIALLFSIVTIINMSKDDIKQSVLCLAGLLVIFFGCGSAAVLLYREYKKKRTDLKRIRQLVLVYWSVFSLALVLITAADFSCNMFSYRFYLYLSIMTVFPLLNVKSSVLIITPFLAFLLVSGLIFGADYYTLFLAVVFSLVYVLISALVYSSHCCLVISDRKLNTANERCRQMDEKDSLTGLLNKKGLTRRLTDIIDRGIDKNIAAVFFDIDNFREYNHGHTDSEGDQCLYNICNCVRITAKSKTDIVSRYGGDEFVLILQDTKEYDLIYFAEQLRSSVERMALPFTDGKDGRVVTVSVGVSSIAEGEFNDYSKLLKEAEDSLSLAKSGGRNCVGYMGNVFRVK